MKHLAAVFLSLALVCCVPYAYSQQDDFSSANGHDWNSYDESSRYGFALGFIVGVHKAVDELDLYVRRVAPAEMAVDDLLPVHNITNTQLKEALDAFYGNTANLAVPVKEAALLVCKEIRTKDTERIEKEKQLLRLPPEKQRVVKRADYLKEKVKRGEYSRYEVKKDKIVEKESGQVVPLETEEEVADFWTEQVFPEEAPAVKEVVKVDYSLAIAVSVAAGIVIALIVFIERKKRREKR